MRQEAIDLRSLHGPAVGLGQERREQALRGLARFERRFAGLHAEQAIVQRALLGRRIVLPLLHGQAVELDGQLAGDDRDRVRAARRA